MENLYIASGSIKRIYARIRCDSRGCALAPDADPGFLRRLQTQIQGSCGGLERAGSVRSAATRIGRRLQILGRFRTRSPAIRLLLHPLQFHGYQLRTGLTILGYSEQSKSCGGQFHVPNCSVEQQQNILGLEL